MISHQTFIIDGKTLSKLYESYVKHRIDGFLNQGMRAPGLGVILVGDNPASRAYVSSKEKLAFRVGMKSFERLLPEDSTQNDVAAVIDELNKNPEVDGILLQLPLPKHLDQEPLLLSIDPKKDADGLHPFNQGLALRGRANLIPCTPQGVMKLIDYYYSCKDLTGEISVEQIKPANLAGLKAVVIGRSVLVGKPLSFLLLERNATVIMAHSKSSDLAAICRDADIVIAAVGVPALVKKEWVNSNAVVIDVGINRLESGKLVGDVDFEQVAPLVKAITPVPGGVGPMTVSMLILNTLFSYEGRINNLSA